MLRAILGSQEYKRKRGVKSAFPAGHYYSPVVDPTTVTDYVAAQRNLRPDDLAGIPVYHDDMLRFWQANLETIKGTTFPEYASLDFRFHYNNGSFPYGDAIMLRTMIAYHRPKFIVEIGSGYTTACMLDTADSIGLHDTRIVCIEPSADRLRALLRPADWGRVSLVEAVVQRAPLSIFTKLRSGDMLFVDSTHVVKTGSDVHFEIFRILPALEPGVVIHFHDVPYPFEYPDEWIFSANHSWNEAYVLQAFLMYNERFRVTMWNSLLAKMHYVRIKTDYPIFLRNPGSSIWLIKV
jgi:predicted O-methyltransferase YrrM